MNTPDLSNGVKIIVFGTSEFAVPALKKLAADSNYEITAVITQPDKPAGRKLELSPSPVKLATEKLGLKVLQPPHLTSPARGEEKDGVLPPLNGEGKGGANLFIVASYGKIIPEAILDLPKYGTLNIHPSLLPKYRGPAPTQAAILNGDTETGVTIMKLDEEMDHGALLGSTKFKITNPKFQDLHDKLAEMGAELLIKILPDYISGKLTPKEQDHEKATFTKIIEKDDARIDWNKPAEEIDRQIRAYQVWPVAWTMLDGKRLKIFGAEIVDKAASPGKISGDLIVGCGKKSLKILELQLEGAKKITAREFANGQKDLTSKTLA